MTSAVQDPADHGNRADGAHPPGGRPDKGQGMTLTVLTYVMLFVFGAAQALVGAFFYGSGPAPLASACFDVAILATCQLGAWGLRRPAGALAPAAGWLIGAFILASGTPGGSVLIAATTAGEWFLFGGGTAAAAGVIAAFVIWPRSARGRSRDRFGGR